MHLGDRRGRERLLVELGEQLLDRTAELDLDDGTHVVEELRRDLVAEQLELVDELVGEEALDGRDDLAELHVAGPETSKASASDGCPPGATAVGGTRTRTSLRGHRRSPSPSREAAERRQSTRCEETWHLLPRPPAEPVDLPTPRKVVGVDHHGPRSLNAPNSRSGEGSGGGLGVVIAGATLPAGPHVLDPRIRHVAA